jgi:hypothetical protein
MDETMEWNARLMGMIPNVTTVRTTSTAAATTSSNTTTTTTTVSGVVDDEESDNDFIYDLFICQILSRNLSILSLSSLSLFISFSNSILRLFILSTASLNVPLSWRPRC